MRAKFINENVNDIFKPKSYNNILKDLNKEYDVEMYELKDGRIIYVYEDIIKDMGGEYVSSLIYLDEFGHVRFLPEQLINLVKDPTERQNLYNWNASLE